MQLTVCVCVCVYLCAATEPVDSAAQRTDKIKKKFSKLKRMHRS